MSANQMDNNDEQIDRILSGGEEILPSAGFTASVMEAVRREAAAPAPIPFPWKRAWPVLVLAALTIVFVPILAATAIISLASAPVSAAPANANFFWGQLPLWMSNPAAGWATGSLLLALIVVKFSMRLVSR
jgi:hypothetical protein